MSGYCVVVAGGTAARIFTLEPAEIPEIQAGPNLVQCTTLVNGGQQSPGDRPGGGPAHNGGSGRGQYDRKATRKFVRRIVSAVERTAVRNGLQHVVLCADRRLLGELRPSLNGNLNGQIAVHEVPKDLAKLSSRQLHDKLSRAGHLPRRRRRRSAV